MNNDDADDELGQLAHALNQTLVRLDHAFEHLRRFTFRRIARAANTAGAMIRIVGDAGPQKNPTPVDSRDIMGNMLEKSTNASNTTSWMCGEPRHFRWRQGCAPVSFEPPCSLPVIAHFLFIAPIRLISLECLHPKTNRVSARQACQQGISHHEKPPYSPAQFFSSCARDRRCATTPLSLL
jgi:hypothetical protein